MNVSWYHTTSRGTNWCPSNMHYQAFREIGRHIIVIRVLCAVLALPLDAEILELLFLGLHGSFNSS